MHDDIVPEDVPTSKVVNFTESAVREIYNRIELIERHFNRCCAFDMDKCRYGDEFDDLYRILQAAGMEEAKTPLSREKFEEWIGDIYGR